MTQHDVIFGLMSSSCFLHFIHRNSNEERQRKIDSMMVSKISKYLIQRNGDVMNISSAWLSVLNLSWISRTCQSFVCILFLIISSQSSGTHSSSDHSRCVSSLLIHSLLCSHIFLIHNVFNGDNNRSIAGRRSTRSRESRGKF